MTDAREAVSRLRSAVADGRLDRVCRDTGIELAGGGARVHRDRAVPGDGPGADGTMSPRPLDVDVVGPRLRMISTSWIIW